jgi:hypothetical protein
MFRPDRFSRREALMLGAAFCSSPVPRLLRHFLEHALWGRTREATPYFPGTVLRPTRLALHAGRPGCEDGVRYIVGPYCTCASCGLDRISLFTEAGRIDRLVDRLWVEAHLEIVQPGRPIALHSFPKPWPPLFAGAA